MTDHLRDRLWIDESKKMALLGKDGKLTTDACGDLGLMKDLTTSQWYHDVGFAVNNHRWRIAL